MQIHHLLTAFLTVTWLWPQSLSAQSANMQDRALWASLAVAPATGEINGTGYKQHNGYTLISWRMLPGDDENTDFDLYRTIGNGEEVRLNGVVTRRELKATCFQHKALKNVSGDVHYRLTFANSNVTIGSYTMSQEQATEMVPYISISLKATDDVSELADIKYQANDCSVGDLDGDGQMEIVVKRLLTIYDSEGNVISDSEAAGETDPRARHIAVFDAYKLDGTFLWRVKSGPNIIAGNSINFAVADLDGDGCCEVVTKTGEGTVFGDGTEIGDTDNDGITDYRCYWAGHYTGPSDKGPGGPEFFSVIDGKTGRELARADFISSTDRGATWKEQSMSWGDDYWKRANSLRIGVAEFTGKGRQIFLGRGIYGRTVVEAWQYDGPDKLSRLWHVDTSDEGGSNVNKDGRPYSDYDGQGNHAFHVADLDGDGYDEVMYGSCAWDNDGSGLWTSGLGHGDASHVGRFLPDREGLQVYHCMESGKTMVALHDARDGSIIWQKVGEEDNDMGRCMVADVDPESPGCEFWYYGNELFSQDGIELFDIQGNRKKETSANAGIWFDGTLNRQMIDGGTVNSFANGRTFTMYRYDMEFINSSKSNPGWYGDMLGDWREEIIVPDKTKLKDLKIFSTWYPTDHRVPWLMTDHTYYMQCIHQQVGYNQPTNLGYYLGSDRQSDSEIWTAARKVEVDRLTARGEDPTGISSTAIGIPVKSAVWYNLMGQPVSKPLSGGLYIHQGKKVIVR